MLNFLPLTWPELHRLCFSVYKKIKSTNEKFDLIVSISRGGLVVARILSDFLTLPIAAFTIESYQTIGKRKDEKITFELKADLSGKKVLLVDEICDTGKTLKRAIKYLKSLNSQEIKTCCLIYKPQAEIKPDFFIKKTSRWVIFPYEVMESIEAIKKLSTGKKINNQLLKLGLPKDQVKYFLKKIK